MGALDELFELRLQGIVVRFDQEWIVTARVPHGAFFSHSTSQLSMHVRGWHRHGDRDWLRDELRSQNWKGSPVDVEERASGDRYLIAGTFEYSEPGKLVREWFISDGRRAANASILFPSGTARAHIEPYERLLDSIKFDAD